MLNRFFSTLKKILIFFLIVSLIVSISYLVYILFFEQTKIIPPIPDLSSTEPPVELHPKSQKPALHIAKYVVGDFGPDEERIAYKNGSMTLYIPVLNTTEKKARFTVYSVDLEKNTEKYKVEGMSDTEIDTQLMVDMNTELDNGLVLFNQSQLPGSENRNVSIAGHRDFKGMEFYYIDLIGEGDLLYLIYNDKEYVYEYEETFITHNSDWDPISVSDKSKLTLQSCDPIFAPNGDYDRIFVVATLIDIIDPAVDNSIYGPTVSSGRTQNPSIPDEK